MCVHASDVVDDLNDLTGLDDKRRAAHIFCFVISKDHLFLICFLVVDYSY